MGRADGAIEVLDVTDEGGETRSVSRTFRLGFVSVAATIDGSAAFVRPGAACDLTVLRVKGEELLYYKTNESRHEVDVPWGIGEELIQAFFPPYVYLNQDEIRDRGLDPAAVEAAVAEEMGMAGFDAQVTFCFTHRLEETARFSTHIEALLKREFPSEIRNIWTRSGSPAGSWSRRKRTSRCAWHVGTTWASPATV